MSAFSELSFTNLTTTITKESWQRVAFKRHPLVCTLSKPTCSATIFKSFLFKYFVSSYLKKKHLTSFLYK